jgi:hypothetical protein
MGIACRRAFVKLSIYSLAVFLGASSMSWGTTIFTEGGDGQGDAGGLPSTANITIGSGSLTEILGKLTDTTKGADMYEINIVDPGIFSATTIGTSTDPIQNPALYLFDANGNGVIGNDNTASGAQASISDSSLAAGLYYLLLTPSGHLPAHGSTDIFGDLTNTTNTSTPGSPIQITKYLDTSATVSPADTGSDYEIDLVGVDFASPEPGTVALMGLGLAALAWRTRRR